MLMCSCKLSCQLFQHTVRKTRSTALPFFLVGEGLGQSMDDKVDRRGDLDNGWDFKNKERSQWEFSFDSSADSGKSEKDTEKLEDPDLLLRSLVGRMDPDDFTASLFKWDPRAAVGPSNRLLDQVATPSVGAAVVTTPFLVRPRGLGGLEDLFRAYGIRYYTATKIAELGFTVSTLLNMKDVELDDMMNSLSQIFRWDLLVGETYGIKAAVRAERRRLEVEMDSRRRHLLSADTTNNAFDALSQEGLSEEPVHQEKEVIRSGGGPREVIAASEKKNRRRRKAQKKLLVDLDNDGNDVGEEEEDDDDINGGNERQREHPFIVTEPGEVARGKKNGLDYLFHLYEQCREFLMQVQNIAKERGEKCPTKVTNQVFRYAKKAGASYINKPKMRHYVHCYALHCLDEEASNALRRAFKERGENVGAWRQACYNPLVGVAARRGWDIDAIFNSHPRLDIWYVPTKLRQLCHSDRNSAAASTCGSNGRDLIPF